MLQSRSRLPLEVRVHMPYQSFYSHLLQFNSTKHRICVHNMFKFRYPRHISEELRTTGSLVKRTILLIVWQRFYFIFHGTTASSGPRPPRGRGFTITLRHAAISRTALDEWPVRRRDLWLHTVLTSDTHAPGGIGTGNPSKRAASRSCLTYACCCKCSLELLMMDGKTIRNM
jgi:hypothetical protein